MWQSPICSPPDLAVNNSMSATAATQWCSHKFWFEGFKPSCLNFFLYPSCFLPASCPIFSLLPVHFCRDVMKFEACSFFLNSTRLIIVTCQLKARFLIFISTLYSVMLCQHGICCHCVCVCVRVCVCVCVSVCLSDIRRYCVKTAKRKIMETMPQDSLGTLPKVLVKLGGLNACEVG